MFSGQQRGKPFQETVWRTKLDRGKSIVLVNTNKNYLFPYSISEKVAEKDIRSFERSFSSRR